LPIKREGTDKLFEFSTEAEIESDHNRIIRIGNVISAFPLELIEIASACDENQLNSNQNWSHIMINTGVWLDFWKMSTKDWQPVLKTSFKKTERLDFEHRLGTTLYDPCQIAKFREQCKNVKLRHIYYRLISRDFYTKERMFRFNMSRNNECERCGLLESYRHLMWECIESRRVWDCFNSYILSLNGSINLVNRYEDVYNIYSDRTISILKVRVIQAMIQIERPVGWTANNIRKFALELKNIEIYNSVIKNKPDKVRNIWRHIN
jgi:hypothetical protein